MVPTIEQVLRHYRIISAAERMKTGRPGEETCANAIRGTKCVCEAAGLVNAGDFIGVSGSKVYMIAKTTGYIYRFDIGASAASTDTVATETETRSLDLGTPHEKVMAEFVLSAHISGSTVLKFYFDGVAAKSTYTLLSSAVGDVCSYVVRPERHKFRSVKVKITSSKPLTLEGFEATFFKTGI